MVGVVVGGEVVRAEGVAQIESIRPEGFVDLPKRVVGASEAAMLAEVFGVEDADSFDWPALRDPVCEEGAGSQNELTWSLVNRGLTKNV